MSWRSIMKRQAGGIMKVVYFVSMWLSMLPCLVQTAAAAEASTTESKPNLRFVNIGTADGLPHTDVRAILQGSRGFMWFGLGMGGLARFDGYEFKVYTHDPDNSQSLAYNSVATLYEDRKGTLWVGTLGGGLDRYDEESDTFVHYRHNPEDPSSLPENTVLALCEDRSGALWVGTRGGLSLLDRETGSFRTFTADPSKPDALRLNSVRCIFEDPSSGMLWIGAGGVAVFDPRTQTVTESFFPSSSDPNSLSHAGVNSIFKDHDGVVWVGTDSGLNRFVPETGNFVRYLNDPARPESLVYNRVVRIVEDGNDRLWIGTRSGLDLLNRQTGEFTHYQNDPADPDSISDNAVLTLYVDQTGLLWIGGFSQGVDRVMAEAKAFAVWQSQPDNPNSLSQNNVLSIYPDDSGGLWVGTQNGLNRYENGSFTRYKREPRNDASLGSDIVSALAMDTAGILWVGTNGAGIFHFDGATFKRFEQAPEFPPATNVTSLRPDSEGGMWIAVAAHGVFHASRSGTIDAHALPSPSASMLYLCGFDENDDLWIGSQNNGILRLDPRTGAFENYLVDPQNPSSEANRQFYTIHPGKDGNVWAGGISGLYNFNSISKRFIRQFTRKDGLPADGVMDILADDSGKLWLGTLSGLTRFDPGDNSFRTYDTHDGLPAKSFVPRASAKTADGRLYFGTRNGLVAFYPQDMVDNPFPPPVALTEFTLFDKSVDIGGENAPLSKNIYTADQVTLRYRQSVFGFKFSALSYIAPEKSRYAYKMERFDPDWRFTDATRRYVTYTRLAPGKYVFRVKASNNDGVWNEEGAALSVIILPPWWATWWFRSIAIATVLILVYAGFALRVSAIKRRSLELERQVALRTSQLEIANRELESFAYSVSHDLRAPLRHIDSFADMLFQRTHETLDKKDQGYMKSIMDAANRMGTLIDDLLSFSRMGRREMMASQVDITSLCEEVIRDLSPDLANRKIIWKIAQLPQVTGDRSMLRVVLVNLISNAIKFTQTRDEALIEIGCQHRNNAKVFFVKDNGVGFDPNYAGKLFGVFSRLHGSEEFEGTGIGLANVRRIIERHGGEVWAEGNINQGATFYFSIVAQREKDHG